MLAGALLVLASGEISLGEALASIHLGVMIFLLAMFIIGVGVHASGILDYLILLISRYAGSGDSLLLFLIFCLGFSSAVLMNDTVAIIATPLVLALAVQYGISKQVAVLALCFSITTGSVFSPIGNPQNYLISSYVPGASPFILFGAGLLIPTIISLAAIWLLLRSSFKGVAPPFNGCIVPQIKSKRMAAAVCIAFVILFLGICSRIVVGLFGAGPEIPIEYLALAAAVPVLLLTPDHRELARRIDWCTLIFFASMFVLMQSVYNTGFFQDLLPMQGQTDILIVLASGILVSQAISNVPFVALFQPALLTDGVSSAVILALAAGSTIAGNLTILGAASNVIVLQQAEREGVSVSMITFCRYGIPLTIVQFFIYAIFLTVVPL